MLRLKELTANAGVADTIPMAKDGDAFILRQILHVRPLPHATSMAADDLAAEAA